VIDPSPEGDIDPRLCYEKGNGSDVDLRTDKVSDRTTTYSIRWRACCWTGSTRQTLTPLPSKHVLCIDMEQTSQAHRRALTGCPGSVSMMHWRLRTCFTWNSGEP